MLIRKFEEQAAKTPDRIAVKSRENWITYRELHACALRVCRAIMSSPLRTTGEESGTVGLLFRHGTDMIAAVLGTLKAGKIYVPLSADYPKNRLAYMVTHSRASLILTAGECETEARVLAVESGISFLNIDDFREPVPAPNPPAPAEADRLAYIMYTSGSTGKPKGVKQNLGNVWYYTRNWIERFGINQEDRMTLFSSFCHDGSVQDMFSALLSGAALYPLDMKSRDGTEALSRFLVKERITVWHSVPSLYTYFTGTLNGEDRGDEYKELRIILLGGEPVREHEIAMRGKYFPRALLANVYGQTESSVNSIWLVRPGDAVNNFVIGEPLDETEIFVVDADGNEVAGLRSGEIVVACAHLSPGYWRDEAAGQSPFETDDEMGPMYWTGDTGRLLPDGRIEFTGRLDAQVKIRGFRIEPGEIESQLLRHEQIKEAVVIDREEAQGDKYLTAYIVGAFIETPQLKKYLSQTLPGYMIPLHFVQMEALPLTPGGKIDRKALPEPEILSTRQYVAPTNEKEERLAEIWSEILGVEKNRIGIHDDFFELGGHSLKMLNLLTRVYKEFKVQLKLTDIFRDSTIAASAGLISRLKQGTYLDIRPVEKREYYDPPFQDIGMWLRCRFQVKDRKPFNMSGIYDLVGVSRVLVETVCRDLVRHHETLRTTFLTVDGEAKIKIHPVESVDVNPDYIDLRKKRMSAKKLRKFLFKLQQSDFDLEKGPVFKITLVQLSDREFKLVFVVPHIISDLWSKVSLEQDFRTLLEAYSNGRKNSLAPLTVQYKDYAAWQHRLFTGERGKRLRAFWLDMLGGELPPPNPLMDFPHNRRTGTYRQLLAEDIRGSFRPLTPEESNSLTGVLASARSVKGTSYRFFIPRDTTDKLNLLAGEARCSFFSVISAAFNILHYLMTGQRDCITGTVVAIRDHEDLKKIQGYFMNTVLFRNQVDEVLTVKEYVVRAAGNISEALDHREYPFEKILAELDVALDTVGSVFLNYSKADGDQEVAVEKLKSGHTPVEHVYFDMDYSIVEFKNGIVVHCNYNNELFKPGTIELISLKFTALTAEMAGAYHRVIKELDID